MKKSQSDDQTNGAFNELEQSVCSALETYSNVHRGSGHKSMVSTHLYEQARDIVLEYLGLDKGRFVVIFCTPRREDVLKQTLTPDSYRCISSRDIGLRLGVRALAVKKKSLPKGVPFQSGGGTARLISTGWVIWASGPDRFEAGTPAIINIIAFARALRMVRKYGTGIFNNLISGDLSASEILYHDELEKYSGRELLDQLRRSLIGNHIPVPTTMGDKPYINLDNGASTPTFTPVWNSVRQTWQQTGQIQKEIIEEVRSVCAGFIGAPRNLYDVIFTSNTTEAINLVAENLSRESGQEGDTVVLNTLLEHSSNELPWRSFPNLSLIRLQVDREGFLDLNELETILVNYNQNGKYTSKRIKLVAVSGASNVLGTYNNLADISSIVHKYGAYLLVDAAQMVAHRKVSMDVSGIDYLAFSAHKVYAPFGCGVLVVKKGLLNFSSSDTEIIRSSGEENAGGIAALGKSLILLQRIGMGLIREEEEALTKKALNGLAGIPGLTVYGINDPQSPGFSQKGGVIVFSMKKIWPDKLARALAERSGIGVRYGCHCAHLLVKHILDVSPFLAQFQGLMLTLLPGITLPGLVRISLGIGNTEEDVEILIHGLNNINEKPVLRKSDIQHQMANFAKVTALKVYSQ